MLALGSSNALACIVSTVVLDLVTRVRTSTVNRRGSVYLPKLAATAMQIAVSGWLCDEHVTDTLDTATIKTSVICTFPKPVLDSRHDDGSPGDDV